MIQIDMEKPSACRWTDENNIHFCPFLDGKFDCLIQGHVGYWSWDGQYKDCPLHEVTADEDTISRKQAIDAIQKTSGMLMYQIDGFNRLDDVDIIKNLPPSPSRPQGHWEMTSQQGAPPTYVYSCSECSYKSFGFYNYCPNCGADMRQEGGGA